MKEAEKATGKETGKATGKETPVCPLCGRPYTEPPAISRKDNLTEICPECGTREALAYLGVSPEEREEIIRTINRHRES